MQCLRGCRADRRSGVGLGTTRRRGRRRGRNRHRVDRRRPVPTPRGGREKTRPQATGEPARRPERWAWLRSRADGFAPRASRPRWNAAPGHSPRARWMWILASRHPSAPPGRRPARVGIRAGRERVGDVAPARRRDGLPAIAFAAIHVSDAAVDIRSRFRSGRSGIRRRPPPRSNGGPVRGYPHAPAGDRDRWRPWPRAPRRSERPE